MDRLPALLGSFFGGSLLVSVVTQSSINSPHLFAIFGPGRALMLISNARHTGLISSILAVETIFPASPGQHGRPGRECHPLETATSCQKVRDGFHVGI